MNSASVKPSSHQGLDIRYYSTLFHNIEIKYILQNLYEIRSLNVHPLKSTEVFIVTTVTRDFNLFSPQRLETELPLFQFLALTGDYSTITSDYNTLFSQIRHYSLYSTPARE